MAGRMKQVLIAVLATLTIVAAVFLYAGHVVYMLAFTVLCVGVAAYASCMARVFGGRLSGTAFIGIWAVAWIGLLSAEGWVRTHGDSPHPGLLPAATMAFDHWKHPDLAAIQATTPAPRRLETAPPDHDSIIDNTSVRRNLTALMVAEFCNNSDLVAIGNSIVSGRNAYVFPANLTHAMDIPYDAPSLQAELGYATTLTTVEDDQIENYRHALVRGQQMLTAFGGPSATAAMQQFDDGENLLISNAAKRQAIVAPVVQVNDQRLVLALRIKIQGSATRQMQAEWNQIAAAMGPARYANIMAAQQGLMRSDDTARVELGRLIGETLWFDPHNLQAFGHCVQLLPSHLQDHHATEYANEISARWDSDAWLTEGQDQQAFRHDPM